MEILKKPRITTLTHEVGLVDFEVRRKAEAFKTCLTFSKLVPIEEQIFKIFLSSCSDDAKRYFNGGSEEARAILDIIGFYVSQNLPIPFSITFALFMRAKNSFKFSQWQENFPHLGWIDFLGRLKYLNLKVKHVYAPGVRVFIFEEASLFHPLIGWDKSDVDRFQRVIEKSIEGLGLSEILIIFPMGEMGLPSFAEWEKNSSIAEIQAEIEDSIVFAMLTMMPDSTEFNDSGYIDLLYTNRLRDYGQIKEQLPELWEKARKRTAYVRSLATMRKNNNLWGKNIEGFHLAQGIEASGQSFLDAAITSKEGRLVFDIGSVFPNHGMAVRTDSRKIQNIPEYRIEDARPVVIREAGEEFVFYYEKF